MPDFKKLRATRTGPAPVEPEEIFRRLPKPAGINDLYTSQAEVLREWHRRRHDRDIVVKLHTGGGKTLVGLLMAQSTINELREPVLYLVPTLQLAGQVHEQARHYGIPTVLYTKGQPLHDDFVSAKAVMVASYKALFNGRSKFGLRGEMKVQPVGAVVLDDSHVAFGELRDTFTLSISAQEDRSGFENLAGLFRGAFIQLSRVGTFDDVVAGSESSVLEVPYWAWLEQLDAVRAQLQTCSADFPFEWPLLRDNLHFCHALISRSGVSITPHLPIVDLFPTFQDAPRRIYMSATIADDSEIVRSFGASKDCVRSPLTSRSLAGIGERMILIPSLMPFELQAREAVESVLMKTANQNLGALVLVPSRSAAEDWESIATVGKTSTHVDDLVRELQNGQRTKPIVLANRYDGIDLQGDACRILVLSGLPHGTSDYERFRAAALYGGASMARLLAQRVEQGIGRGARGAGDYCVVILVGSDLAGWVSRGSNYELLTRATRAQLKMGEEISHSTTDLTDLKATIEKCLIRDQTWTEYHAEALAEFPEESPTETRLNEAVAERKAFDLWRDGYPDKAIARLEKVAAELVDRDAQTAGWLQQLAARIASDWQNPTRADELQRHAFANNKNLFRPKIMPPYRPLPLPGPQERQIVKQLGAYTFRRGLLESFDDVVSRLHANSSAKQFEQSLAEFGRMIGLASERFDEQGVGPDVLWLLPDGKGMVIEAKSRKKQAKALTKSQHGQLLVAAEWFHQQYPEQECVRVSVQSSRHATAQAQAEDSYVLTFEKLGSLVADARALLSELCKSSLNDDALERECAQLLIESNLHATRLISHYLSTFVTNT